jgi:tRNA Pseudouridine synthase II, C terminal.
VTLTPDEVAAVARGQFVRPGGGLPAPADHYRLQDPAGTLVAIASASSGRLAPDKVFVAPAARPAVPVA